MKREANMSSDKKNLFVELRVKGESLGDISKKLSVPKTTLWRWQKEQEPRINELQLADQDEFEHEWNGLREDRVGDFLNLQDTLHDSLITKLNQHAEHLPIKDLFL